MNSFSTVNGRLNTLTNNSTKNVAIASETLTVPAGATNAFIDIALTTRPVLNSLGYDLGSVGDSSLVITSAVLLTEVPQSTEDSAMVAGNYWVDYVNGRIHAKKATSGTTATASYTSYSSQFGNSPYTGTTVNSLPGAQYNATPPTNVDGQVRPLQSDGNGNLNVNIRSHVTGEDQVADRMMTEERNTFSVRIATAATTMAKSGSGVLNRIFIESVTTGITTIYDNTVASGTILTILPLGTPAGVYNLAMPFVTGCTVLTAAADRVIAIGR